MKISYTNIIGRASSSKKKGAKKVKGDFGSMLDSEDEISVSQTPSVGHVCSMDSLLAVQEAVGEHERLKSQIKRGDDILDKLEDIRKDVIIGKLSAIDAKKLSDNIKNGREYIADSVLNDILDEIELRAEVELAKLGI